MGQYPIGYSEAVQDSVGLLYGSIATEIYVCGMTNSVHTPLFSKCMLLCTYSVVPALGCTTGTRMTGSEVCAVHHHAMAGI